MLRNGHNKEKASLGRFLKLAGDGALSGP